MVQKDTRTPVFIAVLFTIQNMEATNMSFIRGTDRNKMWYTYAMQYYSAIQKNEIVPFAATWMDLEIALLTEASQRKINVI